MLIERHTIYGGYLRQVDTPLNVNGTLYPTNAVRVLATITDATSGPADTRSFVANSTSAFGWEAHWGASRTATIDWVFNAIGGAGRFGSFIVNMGAYARANENQEIELRVRINNGSYNTVWTYGAALPVDLGNVGGVNYLAGATNIVLRGYLYQSGSETRAARMMQAAGTAAGLTINASIAEPQGTLIIVR